MLITITNISTNPLSTDVGLLNPGDTKTVSMSPAQAFRAAESFKSLQDLGRATITVVDDEPAKLDAMEPVTFDPEYALHSVDVTITTAQLLALNATPQAVVAAPGAGKCLVFESAILYMPYNSIAYNGVAAGEDFAFKYTNGSGAQVAQVESTGFIDQATNQLRYARPLGATDSSFTPVANAALVLQLLSGEIATGNSPLKVRVYFRVVPSTL